MAGCETDPSRTSDADPCVPRGHFSAMSNARKISSESSWKLLPSLWAALNAHPAGQPLLIAVREAVRSRGPQAGAVKARRRQIVHPSWGTGQVPATLTAMMARLYAESKQVFAAETAQRTDTDPYSRVVAGAAMAAARGTAGPTRADTGEAGLATLIRAICALRKPRRARP
jgi:hypothetical protein